MTALEDFYTWQGQQKAVIDKQREIKAAQDAADAKAHQFNVGSLIPAVIDVAAAPVTGGASLADLPRAGFQAAGEGVRAMTGSKDDLGGIASNTYTTGMLPGKIADMAKQYGLTGTKIDPTTGNVEMGISDATKKRQGLQADADFANKNPQFNKVGDITKTDPVVEAIKNMQNDRENKKVQIEQGNFEINKDKFKADQTAKADAVKAKEIAAKTKGLSGQQIIQSALIGQDLLKHPAVMAAPDGKYITDPSTGYQFVKRNGKLMPTGRITQGVTQEVQ